MLLLAGKADTLERAREMATAVRDNGQALAKFRAMTAAQGGDVAQVDDPALLPQAPLTAELRAPRSGVIAALDTAEIGWTAVHMGAGRQKKEDIIDHAVGFVLPMKVGDQVQAGDVLGVIHAENEAALETARQALLASITWSETAVAPLPHFYAAIT